MAVIPLDQPAAGCIVLAVVSAKPEFSINGYTVWTQTLPKSIVAKDPGAVMVLQRAGNDLSRGSGRAIHHHYDREQMAVVAVARRVNFFLRSAAMVGNDHVVLVQELIRDRHSLI